MTTKTFLWIPAAIAALTTAAPAGAADRFDPAYTYRVVAMRSDVRGLIAGRITEVEPAQRRITVTDAAGMGRRYKAHPRVANLEQVRVEDDVVVEYVRSVRVYERVPGAKAPPKELVEALDADVMKTGAAEGLALAGSGTATLETVDAATRTAVFRGPDGRSYPILVEDALLLKGLEPGKAYDFDLYEAGAVSVEVRPKPAPPPPPPPPPPVTTAKAKLVEKKIEVTEVVYFAVAKADIDPKSYDLLNDVATIMKANPQVKKLRVEGNASKDPLSAKRKDGAEYNRKLSGARADAVKEYLVKQGVEASRLESIGYGWDRPVAPNNTKEGRAKNRRTDFVVVEQ